MNVFSPFHLVCLNSMCMYMCVNVCVCFYNRNQDQHCMSELVTSGKNLFFQNSC